MRKSTRVGFLLLCVGAVLVFHFQAVRPWFRRWGATDWEVVGAMPGDRIVSAPAHQETRAVTIDAPVDDVWPWLAQLGRDRGGFYSYEVLEDLAGADIDNVYVLRPELQTWTPGDKLWMAPPERFAGMGHAVLADLDPGRYLAFATRQTGTPSAAPHDGSWTFALTPVDERTSRLVIRGRATKGRSPAGWLFDRLVFEPAHFAMERKLMLRVKALAEGRSPGTALGDTLQVAGWFAAFLAFVWAAVRVLRTSRWGRAAVAFFASALGFQLLTLGQPPLAVVAGVVAALALLLWATAPRERPVAVPA